MNTHWKRLSRLRLEEHYYMFLSYTLVLINSIRCFVGVFIARPSAVKTGRYLVISFAQILTCLLGQFKCTNKVVFRCQRPKQEAHP